MKKGIIAITLLLTGALFITPITTNANSTKDDSGQVKVEQLNNNENTQSSIDTNNETTQNEIIKEDEELNVENTYKPETNNQSVTVETVKDEIVKEEATNEVVEEKGMTKAEAEVVLNNYLNNTQQSDITYTYQGDENTFEAMQQKGIRGYVFLPNVDTDMAYLVDRDNGSIYYFHSSGYFQQI